MDKDWHKIRLKELNQKREDYVSFFNSGPGVIIGFISIITSLFLYAFSSENFALLLFSWAFGFISLSILEYQLNCMKKKDLIIKTKIKNNYTLLLKRQ